MTCTKCGVNRDDPTRDFYPLWSEDHCVFAQRTVFRWLCVDSRSDAVEPKPRQTKKNRTRTFGRSPASRGPGEVQARPTEDYALKRAR